MSHKVCVHLANKLPEEVGIVGAKKITLREKLLRLLFGAKHKLMVLVPGDSVESLDFCQLAESNNEEK